MDERRSIAQRQRMKDIKGHAVALLMLGLALLALYTQVLYLAVVPLLWMAFRAGKEQGCEEAHQDIERASQATHLIQVPDRKTSPASTASPRVTRFPQH